MFDAWKKTTKHNYSPKWRCFVVINTMVEKKRQQINETPPRSSEKPNGPCFFKNNLAVNLPKQRKLDGSMGR